MLRTLFTFLCLFSFVAGFAQSKQEQVLVERTYLLSHTVFGTKDSATLANLFARQLSYGHSHGNLQNRQEALSGISKNRSNYTDTSVSNIQVVIEKNVAIVRHLFKAKETNKDGKVTQLNFAMMLVWTKEKSGWKLMGRQAVSLD